MSTLYIDCIGGIAGDMLLGALIDAGATVDLGGLGVEGLRIELGKAEKHGIVATTVNVVGAPSQPHRHWSSIRAQLDEADLPERARQRAQNAFEKLAIAEGRIHGIDPEHVHFHEVGAVDAIGEVVGVALALESLQIDKVICSPLPMGRGFTTAAHGRLPLPAPATVSLLEGAPVHGVDVEPRTRHPYGRGARRLAHRRLRPDPGDDAHRLGLRRRNKRPRRLPERRAGDAAAPTSRVAAASSLIEANLDDLLPELAPDAAEACFKAGALDVWTAPVTMKRGRPGFVLSALAKRGSERDVATAILRETSTLGVRIAHYDRIELQREHFTVTVAGEPVADQGRKARRQGRQPRARARGLRARGAHQRRAGEGRVGEGDRGGARMIEQRIRALGSAVVAFSGGVDSSVVAALAYRALKDKALAVTAVSPSVATGELDGARRVAAHIGIAHEIVRTDELAGPGYRANGPDRCYFCKTELYDARAARARAGLRRAPERCQPGRPGRLATGAEGGRRARCPCTRCRTRPRPR